MVEHPGFDVELGFLEDAELGITGRSWRVEIPTGFRCEFPIGSELVCSKSVFYIKN